MKVHRHAHDGKRLRPATAWNRIPVPAGSFLAVLLMALLLLATTVTLAAPAEAERSDDSREITAVDHTALVGVADSQRATLVGRGAPRGGLPFDPHDLAILLFGGAVVTVAAASAPLLLRPLRLTSRAVGTTGTGAEPHVSTREHRTAHAPA